MDFAFALERRPSLSRAIWHSVATDH